MTDARAQIADAIWSVTDEGTFEHGTDGQSVVNDAADAILAAFPSILRGMVKPLKWTEPYESDFGHIFSGKYEISNASEDGSCGLFISGHYRTEHDDVESAQAAANEHNVSAVLADMGVV